MTTRSPFALSLAVFALVGCASRDDALSRPDAASGRDGPLATCTVDIPADVTAVMAFDDGIAIARASVVHRMRGAGCALTLVGPQVAAEQLLDVDDNGSLYVFPAEATTPHALSTMLEGEYPQSMVARVSMDDHVDKLLPAGRGIWSFGVSPAGDALWVDACGPTGLFEVTPDGVSESALDEPSTLWGALPAVLTDEHTFWSVGPRTCDLTVPPPTELTDACGHALVRTTPDGDVEVGATIVDFGDGFEQGTLARCGAQVCGVFASAVVVWDDDGLALDALTRADLSAAADEVIASVTGNHHGLYVTLRGVGGARVVFAPRPPA